MSSKKWYGYIDFEALSRHATVIALSDYVGAKMQGLGSGTEGGTRNQDPPGDVLG